VPTRQRVLAVCALAACAQLKGKLYELLRQWKNAIKVGEMEAKTCFPMIRLAGPLRLSMLFVGVVQCSARVVIHPSD
jgi:hypothetical protein